ncbi:transposase [Longispora sp. NPDC051575]|uniref:transposase n=1 Tax=Longispora sp. NPDC051575 TaxID=3154943 RepID=UPI00342F598F
MQAITSQCPEWIYPFTGLTPRQFKRVVAVVRRRGGPVIADRRPGRQWTLVLADRVLLLAVYYRTNLNMRQVALLFGVSTTAAHRIIDRLAPLLDTEPVRRMGPDEICIVDGTLVPVHDRRMAASSKNYRHSVNLQVLIHADKRLVLAVGEPMPGNRNDCTAYAESGIAATAGRATVVADGGYQGTNCVMPHRRRAGQDRLEGWKEDHNASHRRVRARVEHVFARMKNWKILRDCRRKGRGVYWAAAGIARFHNLALAG